MKQIKLFQKTSSPYPAYTLLFKSFLLIASLLFSTIIFSHHVSALKTYNLSFSTDNTNLSMDAQVTPELRTYIYKHQISLDTNNPDGARIYLSSKDQKTAPTNDEPLHLGAYGMLNLYPSFGTIDHPAKLSPTHFGFAIGKDISEPSQHFSDSTNYESDLEEVKRDAFFAGIPASSSLVKIYSGPSKSFPVYYGAYLDSMIKEGPHKMDIFYTVIGEGTTGELPEENHDIVEVAPSKVMMLAKDFGGEDYNEPGEAPLPQPQIPNLPSLSQINNIIKIKTNIKSNGSLTPQDIKITVGDKVCGEIKIDQSWNSNLAQELQISCKIPSEYGTIKKAWDKNDLNLKIEKYGINLTKKQAVQYIPIIPMQLGGCESMIGIGDSFFGLDIRDGEIYNIEKLKDGRCWMKENLRFKLDKNRELTDDDTDLGRHKKWTPPRSTETSLSENWDNDPEGVDTVRSYYDPAKPENGVYYTFNAAVAGGYTPSSGDQPYSGYSVCPAGWVLPEVNAFGPLSHFYHGSAELKMGGQPYYSGVHDLLNPTPGFVFSKNREALKHPNASDKFGNYWTKKVVDTTQLAYGFYYNINTIKPEQTYHRNFGLTIRCVSDGGGYDLDPKTINDVEYIQDVNRYICANSPLFLQKVLTDKRDNEKYTVARLRDGNCWMTQNLRLKLDTNKPLTSEYTAMYGNTSWTPSRSTETTLTERWDQDPEESDTVRSYYDPTKPENGAYYSLKAAIAGQANGDNGNICPKNWYIPEESDFKQLFSLYELETLLHGQPSYALSGFRHAKNNNLEKSGMRGLLWANSRWSGSSYFAEITPSMTSSDKKTEPYHGLPVRCFENAYGVHR